jgi:hypothetical protein
MLWSRRHFVRLLSLLPTAVWSRFAFSRTPSISRLEARRDELAHYCDALVPADNAPAASALGRAPTVD